MTKWHGFARSAGDIAGLVSEAFRQLRSGHPRPVALEIPADVLQAITDAPLHERAPSSVLDPDLATVREAARWLRDAKFPVIQAGGGAAAADSGEALVELATRLQAPVVMTEGARGLVGSRHALALTSLGGRAVFPHADVVLVVGSRFVDGQGSATWLNPSCRFIYVNLEPTHMAAPRQAGLQLRADARSTLESLLQAIGEVGARSSRAEDMSKVAAWCASQLDRIQPQMSFVRALRSSLPDDAILVSELTQVGYFANIAYPVERPRSYVTPGYQGSLGYGFPTALGAAVGNPHRRVVSITGDGGFGWGMQELATAARYRLDLTIVVFVDGRFGNVQRIQRRVFAQEFATEVANPNFELLAAAFGIPFRRADDADGLAAALTATASTKGPTLIEARVGEMPSPWALIHPFVPAPLPPPENPLGARDGGGAPRNTARAS